MGVELQVTLAHELSSLDLALEPLAQHGAQTSPPLAQHGAHQAAGGAANSAHDSAQSEVSRSAHDSAQSEVSRSAHDSALLEGSSGAHDSAHLGAGASSASALWNWRQLVPPAYESLRGEVQLGGVYLSVFVDPSIGLSTGGGGGGGGGGRDGKRNSST